MARSKAKSENREEEEEDNIIPSTPIQKNADVVNSKTKSKKTKKGRKVPQTPGPKNTNVYSTSIPARNVRHMTRAVCKHAPEAHIAIPPPERSKRTKIPPGIGLDQIPSAANLRPKTRRANRKPESNVVSEELNKPEANEKKIKGKSISTAKKSTIALEALESSFESSSEASSRFSKESCSDKLRQDATRTTRCRSIALRRTSTLLEEPGAIDVASRALRSTRATRFTHAVEPEPIPHSPPPYAVHTILRRFKPWATNNKLWKLDGDDVDVLKKAIKDHVEGAEVLGRMLDVVEKFQTFRDCLDGFLEEVDGLGLELDREGEEGGEDEDEDEDEDEVVDQDA